MERTPIKILPYAKVQFKFVSDHYDVHLNGSCLYDNSICEFRTDYPFDEDEQGEGTAIKVEIYPLNWREKAKWLWKQWWFEKCIGYHWSYRNGKLGQNFYHRKPKWLYKWLFKRYYGM